MAVREEKEIDYEVEKWERNRLWDGKNHDEKFRKSFFRNSQWRHLFFNRWFKFKYVIFVYFVVNVINQTTQIIKVMLKK